MFYCNIWGSLNSMSLGNPACFGCTVDNPLYLGNSGITFTTTCVVPCCSHSGSLWGIRDCTVTSRLREEKCLTKIKRRISMGSAFSDMQFPDEIQWLTEWTAKSSAWLKWMDGWMKLMSLCGHGPAVLQYMARTQCKIWPINCLQKAFFSLDVTKSNQGS